MGVHVDLRRVMALALKYSAVDFGIIHGLRTEAEEAQYVAEGKSQTMNSRHLTGHAVDVIADIDGIGSWEATLYPRIADAVRRASIELNVPVTWGGCWNKTVGDIETDCAAALGQYVDSQHVAGKSALQDLGHFELSWAAYP
jgi:peptidoglycan L-alanyl-D-glutamate endopeptidase CwlK